jgi:NitT/TauT family transport system ATP-binding protein
MDEPFGALDALTREQLYGDIQRIWSQHRKTIVFVTHNVREAVCLGDRVILFSPNPGRIREEFAIPLPRSRDINSVDLARYSTEITRVLKGYVQPEVAGGIAVLLAARSRMASGRGGTHVVSPLAALAPQRLRVSPIRR